MATHTTLTCLLGATLLLGATSCAHHEAAPVGTGSYLLNGRSVSSQATASLYTGNKGIDVLTINLTTTPQPASGPETFSLVFQKLKAQANTDYTHREAYFNGNGQHLYSPQATIAPTASGSFSGTFSVSPGYGTTDSIRAGVFTEARVQ